MTFSEHFIRKPVMTTLIMVALLLFGIGAYFQLPISDLPSVDYPVMTISVVYPGASPATMASTVASPLENQCMQIPGLQSIISDNTDGQTTITLTFDLDRNIDLAAPDVQAAISRAMNDLPSDLPTPPTYSKNNPSDAPVFYLMVTSDTMTAGQLYDFGHRAIGQRISMIKGVSQVQVWGAKTAVRIQVYPRKLAALKIGINEVAGALQTGTVTIPAGSLNGKFRTFSIEPKGQLLKASDYKKLIVAYRNNAPVRLGDIASCVDSLDNDVVDVMFGETREKKMRGGSVCVAISRQGGANTVALSRKIRETIDETRKEIPGSVKLTVFYDKAVQIVDSVNDVKTTIVLALILVVLVIFLFIGRVSDTVIPSITLPFSIVGTFILMKAAGFSLDNLSLMAITLSVGFLVDDAIVVLENSVRHIEMGEKPFVAAIRSSREITFTVISTSVALITVFVPLIFMGGVVGRNFREFALTVVFAIICSTIIALTLTPMMCARMLKPSGETKTRMQKMVDKFEGGIKSRYGVLLTWVLHHRFVAVIVWVLCIGGTLWMFMILPKSFMPEGDSGAISGQMVMQQGTSTDQIRKFQGQVNDILINDPNIQNVFTASGLRPGADQSTAVLVATLKPLKERKQMTVVVQSLRRKMAGLNAGFVYIMAIPAMKLSAGGESKAAGSAYAYTLTSSDRDTLYKVAQQFQEKIESRKDIFIGVQTSAKLNMPQLTISMLRDRASSLGITVEDIEYGLSLAFAGGKTTTYKTDVDQYDVVVELAKEYRKVPENLASLYLRSSTGALVPLGSVVTWEETVGPQNVPHSDQLNSVTISFSLVPGVPLGNATAVLHEIERSVLPPTVSGSLQGEAQEFEEAVKSLGILLLVAVFIMYIILGILYESYIHPFTVLTTLPVAAFGGVATLLLFNSELSIYAYIGMFMLLGIVAKNGIMMVDFAKQAMDEGKNGFDAIHGACLTRFRPILMTGLSTIMGAMPIALGYGADGTSRQPLGLIVVGGLAFAQVITLFVTPGIFLYMQSFQEKVLNRFELLKSGAERRQEEQVD